MTTTTANSTPAGSDCSSSSSSDTDSCDERRSLSWRVLRAVKNSSVFGVLKPSAKVTPGTEEEEEGEEETFDDIGKKTLDDIETGSTSSADTSPITPETQKSAAAEAGAAVVVGSSGALGVDLDDLEAGKQQAGEDRCTQSVSFVGRLLIMYSGERGCAQQALPVACVLMIVSGLLEGEKENAHVKNANQKNKQVKQTTGSLTYTPSLLFSLV